MIPRSESAPAMRPGHRLARRLAAWSVLLLLPVAAAIAAPVQEQEARNAAAKAATAANVMTLTVKGLSRSYTRPDGSIATATAFNRMVVSLTLCVPGTRHCTVVDNVMVDTGSVGLRLQDNVLSGLELPGRKVNGAPVAECFGFTGSNVWGDVKRADVYFGRLVAPNMSLQVANAALPRPTDGHCTTASYVPASNGTLGIGWGNKEPGLYYGCGATGCTMLDAPLPRDIALANPVSLLPVDNNGELFVLPPASGRVAKQVVGQLIFGVNTEPNNRIATATDTIIQMDGSGHFSTSYSSTAAKPVTTTFAQTYIDSGTQTFGFPQSSIGACAAHPDYYCVTDPALESQPVTVLANGTNPAFDIRMRLAQSPGPSGPLTDVYDDLVFRSDKAGSFAWGLPFFLGRRVALVRKNSSAAPVANTGPYYALRDFDGASR